MFTDSLWVVGIDRQSLALLSLNVMCFNAFCRILVSTQEKSHVQLFPTITLIVHYRSITRQTLLSFMCYSHVHVCVPHRKYHKKGRKCCSFHRKILETCGKVVVLVVVGRDVLQTFTNGFLSRLWFRSNYCCLFCLCHVIYCKQA